MATWLLICGSPRPNGTSAKIARAIEMRVAAERPEVELSRFDVSECAVRGCNGCDYCKPHGRCIMDDCMGGLIDRLLAADRVLVVAPVYFAGVPSQFKAVLDRLQPLYWRREALKAQGKPLPEKRPLNLYIVGEGGDPHGYAGLVESVRSALALADLRLCDDVQAFIGVRTLRAQDILIP